MSYEGQGQLGQPLLWTGSRRVWADNPYVPITLFDPTVGTGADDSAAFQTAINTLAGTGRRLWVPEPPSGSYLLDTGLSLPSNTWMEGAGRDKVLFTVNLALAGFFSTANVGFLAAHTFGAAGHLTAASLPGSRTVVADIAPAVGDVVLVNDSNFLGSSYQVTNVAGGGPFTITLDRALCLPMAIGYEIQVVTRAANIDLSGFRVTGPCLRMFEFIASKRCRVHDVLIDDSGGFCSDRPGSMDSFTVECDFERVDVSGKDGLALEIGENCKLIDCTFYGRPGVGTYGFAVLDGVNPSVIRCCAYSNGTGSGVTIGSNGSTYVLGATVEGGIFVGNAIGIQCANTLGTAIRSATIRGNTNGLILNSDELVKGCDIQYNVIGVQNNGAYTAEPHGPPRIVDCDTSFSGTQGIVTQVGDMIIRGWTDSSGASDSKLQVVSGTCRLDTFEVTQDTVGAFPPNAIGLRIDAGQLEVSDGFIHCTGANNQGIVANGGIVIEKDVTIDGAGLLLSIVGNAPVTIREERTRTAAPRAGTAYWNVGNIVSAGTGAVQAIPFPDLQADPADPVLIVRSVNGGAPGLSPLIAKVPGVGFNFTSIAGDTSTYPYRIG